MEEKSVEEFLLECYVKGPNNLTQNELTSLIRLASDKVSKDSEIRNITDCIHVIKDPIPDYRHLSWFWSRKSKNKQRQLIEIYSQKLYDLKNKIKEIPKTDYSKKFSRRASYVRTS